MAEFIMRILEIVLDRMTYRVIKRYEPLRYDYRNYVMVINEETDELIEVTCVTPPIRPRWMDEMSHKKPAKPAKRENEP